MPKSASAPPDSTFIVRFRREWSASGPRWQGWIEHVQSGEEAAFLSLDQVLGFFRRFGAMPDDGIDCPPEPGDPATASDE